MLKVTSIIEPMKIGINRPFLVVCNDQKQYVMKCKTEITNDKILFNELIGNRVSYLLNLPAPKCHCARLSIELINSSPDLRSLGAKPGTVFVSQFTPGSPAMMKPVFDSAVNYNDFGGIIFFDQLLMNTDRGSNGGNWFYDRKEKKVILIDNSNIFRMAAVWDQYTLISDERIPPVILNELDGRGYQLLKSIMNKKSSYPFDKIKRRAKQITHPDINKLFSNIPSDWDISKEDKTAANHFITFQFDHTDDIISQLETKFKDTNKGGK
ncbi:hypothetical protein JK167_11600 [Levilactobacillus brevis]|uniref:HipA-like kinase domain-containing protein n=1 Tax=Levilactobacillus brevis TaxID=1580 RepID=A0AA41ERC9_LEVBR|nr:HipA family kinase [Levilactobacillus brevis]MBS0948327.1 hypothetical protein [Levilactobacillus brevis]MBS1011472.1 hypothetical protein [Levilactobacillus brevis]